MIVLSYRRDLQTYLLLDAEATRIDILDLIGMDLPLSVHNDDVVLVYFAGHGSPEVHPGLGQASRFLVCHDGVFSFHLLAELSASGTGAVVGLPTLYDIVFSRVRARTGGRQNPVLWGNLKGASLPRLVAG